jgi:hypothetical protein
MKKLIIFGFIFLQLINPGFAQEEKQTGKIQLIRENAFIGGSLSLSFGQQGAGFFIGTNPYYGYSLKKWIDMAAVLNFQYSNTKLDPYTISTLFTGYKTNSTLVGLGLSTRIYPIDYVFLQLQPEINYIHNKETPLSLPLFGQVVNGPTVTKNITQPSFLMGAGYKRGFTRGKSFAYISILLDVINSKNSPYRLYNPNTGSSTILPIYRAGINFSLADTGKNRNNK